MNIKERLQFLIKKEESSYIRLGEIAQVSGESVHKWGKTGGIKTDARLRLKNRLRVNVDQWLIEGKGNPFLTSYIFDKYHFDDDLRPLVEDGVHRFYVIRNESRICVVAHDTCELITERFGNIRYYDVHVFHGNIRNPDLDVVSSAANIFELDVTTKVFDGLIQGVIGNNELTKKILPNATASNQRELLEHASQELDERDLDSSPKAKEVAHLIMKLSASGQIQDDKIEAIATLLHYQPGKLAGMADHIKRGLR